MPLTPLFLSVSLSPSTFAYFDPSAGAHPAHLLSINALTPAEMDDDVVPKTV